MSDNDNFGFGKFVPGFDFLQNLTKGAAQAFPQIPDLSNWVAPTLNLEELEKRIGELRAVHFWLDQNSAALGATIQALEVQKMTLATLKGMNFDMGDVADALKLKPAATLFGGAPNTGARADERQQGASPAESGTPAGSKPARKSGQARATAPGVIDPLQWWGALTQQFQQIAASALKDVANQAAVGTSRKPAAGPGKAKTGAARAATAGVRKSPARRPAKKSAGR